MRFHRAERPEEVALEKMVNDYVNTLTPLECVALLGGGIHGLQVVTMNPAYPDVNVRATAVVHLGVLLAIAHRLGREYGYDDSGNEAFEEFMLTFSVQYNSLFGGA